MRINFAASLFLLVAACSSAPPPNHARLTWPPASVSAPAEVVWVGAIDSLRPRGLGGFLRTLAGADKMDLQWSLARPVNVALGHGRIYIVVDATSDISNLEFVSSSIRDVNRFALWTECKHRTVRFLKLISSLCKYNHPERIGLTHIVPLAVFQEVRFSTVLLMKNESVP